MHNDDLFPVALKASLDSQIGFYKTLHETSLDYLEEMLALGSHSARTGWNEQAALGQRLLSSLDPKETFAWTGSHLQEHTENLLAAYGQALSLTCRTQGKMRSELEARIEDTQREILELLDKLASSAPSPSRHALSLLKSAIDSAGNSYDQLNRSSRQVSDLVDVQMATVASRLPPPSDKGAARHVAQATRKK